MAFYTRSRQLRKVPLAGGTPVSLTDVPFWRTGAVWRRNGTIVMMSDARGLYVVPDHGGPLVPLTEVDTAAGEFLHAAPQELADGRLLMTVVMVAKGTTAGARLAVLEPGESRPRAVPGDPLPPSRLWAEFGARTTYVEPGYLISRPGNETVAMPYDLARGRSAEQPVPVLEGAATPAVNARGDVAYYAFPKPSTERFFVLVDRAGSAKRLPVAPGSYSHPRLSPDGTRVVLDRGDDIWTLDLRSYAWTRLTSTGEVTEPQWSGDGRRILHSTVLRRLRLQGPRMAQMPMAAVKEHWSIPAWATPGPATGRAMGASRLRTAARWG